MKRSVKTAIGYLMSAALIVSNASSTLPVTSGIAVRHSIYAAEGEEFTYTAGDTVYTCEVLENGTIAILSCEGAEGILEIPDRIDEREVTAVEGCAFMETSGLREVLLPATVTEIGGFAFAKCPDLERIVLQGDMINIGR